MLFKSVETFRDYTSKNSKLFLLLAFLCKVTAYRVKSHLNRVLSYLSLSMKTSVVLSAIVLINLINEIRSNEIRIRRELPVYIKTTARP